MALVEDIESRRFLDDLFEAAERRGGAVAANQQRDFADVGNIFEQVDKPDLADESRYADEKQMSVREIFAYRQAVDLRSFPEECNGFAQGNGWQGGRLQRVFKMTRLLRPA